jgi:hypothetical protein
MAIVALPHWAITWLRCASGYRSLAIKMRVSLQLFLGIFSVTASKELMQWIPKNEAPPINDFSHQKLPAGKKRE